MNAKSTIDNGPRQTSGRAKKRILILDDDVAVRNAIGRVLRDAGYEVMQAGEEHQALAQFDAKEIDLLLLDLGLPNKSGWDMFEAFTNKNPTLPVIIITGQSRQSEMAMAAGVGALMEKPLDVAHLLQTMEELLGESEEARLRRVCGYGQDGRYVSRYFRAGK
jgi:DNA-binding response OmpR family regulator